MSLQLCYRRGMDVGGIRRRQLFDREEEKRSKAQSLKLGKHSGIRLVLALEDFQGNGEHENQVPAVLPT